MAEADQDPGDNRYGSGNCGIASGSEGDSLDGDHGNNSHNGARVTHCSEGGKNNIEPERTFRPSCSHRQWVIVGLIGLLLLWLGMIFAAPFMLEPDTVDFGPGGVVGRNEFAHERDRLNMTGWVRFIYWEGDMNHHLKANRSFFANGNQQPEDTRDIGIYFGLIAGLVLFFRRTYPLPFWAILLGLTPMGLDGGIQLTGIYESANWLRVLTGFVSGLTLGMVIAHMGTDISYTRALRRAWQEGRPYLHPSPNMPPRYMRAFLVFVNLSIVVTSVRIIWYLG